jgi:hypothetical protein
MRFGRPPNGMWGPQTLRSERGHPVPTSSPFDPVDLFVEKVCVKCGSRVRKLECAGTSADFGFQRIVVVQFSLALVCLCGHNATLRLTLANRRNTPSDVQPAIFLAEAKKVVGVGDFARNDLFFSLLINH